MSEEEIERALRLMDKKEREWFDSRKDRIKNINNMVDDLEKDKKVQKVVEIFSRWQDPTIEKLQQENKQLKEVIEEVREYINNNTEFEHDGDDYGYTEWVNIKPQNIVFVNELLQILDKVKEI